jgi:hypothetical protein
MSAASGEVNGEKWDPLDGPSILRAFEFAGSGVTTRSEALGDRLHRSRRSAQILDNWIDRVRAISADDCLRPH